MTRIASLLMAGLLLTGTVPAQDQDVEPPAEADTEEPQEEVAEPEIDETGLDDQGFTDEDDDFRPSEDIPADQSIPFPTDI